MRRKRHTEEAVSNDRWMLSYADFITLLFAFFVVLFASAYRDNQAIRKLSRAIHNGFQTLGAFSTDESGSGGPNPSLTAEADHSSVSNQGTSEEKNAVTANGDILDLRRQLEAAMGKELKNHELSIQVTPEGFVISLKELGFFDSGQAALLPGAQNKIARIAKVLAAHGLEIRVEGHSDDQPIHTAEFRSNWELSTARAMAVMLLLVNDSGFDPKKISVSGFGQYRPTADNATPEGRRMNRRVDLVVVEKIPPHPNTR